MRPISLVIICCLGLLFPVGLQAQTSAPLTFNASRPFVIEKGLEGRHVAMWGSHGMYYELGNARWEWQRPRLMQVVEDKFPTSFVLQYLAPMMENAGAVVLMPRERDTNPYEVVVDNDGCLATSPYEEHNGQHDWQSGREKGFAWDLEIYRDGQNPFERGTYRKVNATHDKAAASYAIWTPDIPVTRRYAVYVSYQSLPHSATDAQYTVHHKGGTTTFRVNQQMGGGTWVYLGTFLFDRSGEGKVVLSNVSGDRHAVITADAVRFGGGMGNVARGADGERVYDNTKIRKAKAQSRFRRPGEPRLDIPFETSGVPRYLEAARYYLQWAGMPMSVYSESQGSNDYTDDYKCRALWVNHLAGGSRAWPHGEGLGIPLDCSFGFHTDGGVKSGNQMVGTLAIYHTREHGGRLGNGTSRVACRQFSDKVYQSLIHDIGCLMEPLWTGRKSVERNYNEAAQPHVPAMLLELLSHENFAEMRYGLDPRFRFVVSRAIYKGILRFIAQRSGTDYVVQPLPVNHFATSLEDDGRVRLTWHPVLDPLEATATPEAYVVYRRVGEDDFDNGTLVQDTCFTCHVPKDQVVSFRVTAVNKGGQSMPSETLSVGISSKSVERPVLVINGFERIGGPDDFVSSDDRLAGFLAWQDNGVPDGCMLEYAGAQKEYDRSVVWTDDDSPGFGSCTGEYERLVIAGNTFDYPALHGRSLLKNARSFVSVSSKAAVWLSDTIVSRQYAVIDLILGKQKQSKLGRPGLHPLSFKTFDLPLQRLLERFCRKGGSVFVSGSYVASDLWQNPLAQGLEADKNFARSILKYEWRDDKASTCGRIRCIPSVFNLRNVKEFSYYHKPNEESYVVESPDAIMPADSSSVSLFRYADNGKPAGIAFVGNVSDPWRTVVLGFPFESVREEDVRDELMKQVMDFLYYYRQ